MAAREGRTVQFGSAGKMRNRPSRSGGRIVGWRLVLPSTLVALLMAASLLGEDQPYRAYRLRHKKPSDIEKLLLDALPELRDSGDLIADSRTQQILLRGPESYHEVAAQLIRSADVPAPEANVPRTQVRHYQVAPSEVESVSEKLRHTYGERLRIAAWPDEGRLFVLGSPGVLDEMEQRIASLRRVPGAEPRRAEENEMLAAAMQRTAQPPAPQNQQATARTSGGAVESARKVFVDERANAPRERFVPVRPERLVKLETRMREFLAHRLLERKIPGARVSDYMLRIADGRSVNMIVDYDQSGVLLRGPATLVDQTERLLRVLDQNSGEQGQAVQVLSVERTEPTKLRTAIDAYRQPARDPAKARPQPEATDSGRREPARRGPQNPAPEVAPVAFQQPLEAGEADLGQPTDPVTEEVDTTPSRLRELATDVDVESLPDLNVIILRGRQQDVEELSRIIRELERISAETQPEIEIYYLRYTRDAAISDLIEQINEDLTLTRKGRVTVLPLVKPNALLLIGWGDAVVAVKELIARLDQPVSPSDQVRVFPLKHATAQDLLDTVEEFFDNRDGLGPEVIVTADERTNSLIVHAAPRDLAEVAALIERLDVPRGQAIRQARIFPLRNSLAADLAETLMDTIEAATGQPGANGRKSAALELLTLDTDGQRRIEAASLEEVEVTPDVRANALIVTGSPEALDIIALLIEQLDTPIGTAQIKIFRIVNGDAADLIEMLRALLPAPTTNVPPLPLAAGEASLVPLRFSLDSRTNSIIASGSPGDLQIVEALLLRLDERDVRQRQNTVYRLRNSPAVAVAAAVNEFLRSERQVQQAAPQAVNLLEQIEREVVVVPEPVSNSLIVSATPQFYEDIMQLVEQLDAQPAQVVIQVLIGEVQLNNVDEFGIELGLQDSVLFDRSLLGNLVTTTETIQTSTPAGIVTTTNQVIQAASNEPGFLFNSPNLGNSGSTRALQNSDRIGTQGLSNFAVGRINDELGYGGLVLSASSESVSVLIRALQETRRMEILSRPQITTLDNQPAFIQVGQRVPRVTGSNINQIGFSNTVELENVGLILGVTPRISPDGMVVMEVDAEKSEVGPTSEGIPISVTADGTPILSPRVNITTAQTTVSAADGETIILGGLITRNSLSVERGVPYLSDIPILGNLFRYDGKQTRRSELLIILTPRVIRSPDDMERLKRTEAARMSWCAADLHRMHGDTGMCSRENCPICEAGTVVVYPDVNPRGVPLENIPLPEPVLPYDAPGSNDFPDFGAPGAPEAMQMQYQVPVGGPMDPGVGLPPMAGAVPPPQDPRFVGAAAPPPN